MKKSKIFFGVLMLLPLLLGIVFYPALPDKIPMHYGLNMEVDRWGEKFEIFVFPFLTIFIGFTLQNVTQRLALKEQTGPNNQKLSEKVSYATLILFNLLFIYIIYTTLNGITNVNELPIPMGTFTAVIMGLFLIFIGNISPKAKLNKNSWMNIGFRTPWSMKNEETWRRTQIASGYVSVVAGLVLILVALFAESIWMPVTILVTLLSFVFGVGIYSYWLAQKY